MKPELTNAQHAPQRGEPLSAKSEPAHVGERAVRTMRQLDATADEVAAVIAMLDRLLMAVHAMAEEIAADAHACEYAREHAHKRLVRLSAAAMLSIVETDHGASGIARVTADRPRLKPRRGLISRVLFACRRRRTP